MLFTQPSAAAAGGTAAGKNQPTSLIFAHCHVMGLA
jgi:hypothetical protein